MSQFFALGGQSVGASASASALPMNIQGSFPLGLTGLNSYSPRDSQASCPAYFCRSAPPRNQSPPLSHSSLGQGRWLKGALKCGVGDLAGKETLGMRIQCLLQQHVRLNCLQGCFINEQDMHWLCVKSPQSLFGFKLSLLQYMCLWGIEALKQL